MNDLSLAIDHSLWDESLPCATPPAISHAAHVLADDLFEQAPIGIAFTDRRGQFVRCNAAFGALLGREPAEIVRRSVNDLTHADDAAATAQKLELLWNGIIPVVDLQKRYLHQDGHALWVRATIALLRRGPSEPTIAVEYLRDISKRMLAEDALRNVSERFALAADAAGIGIWEWNIGAQTLHWDDHMYRLHGLDDRRGEAPETLLAASIHVDDQATAERDLKSPPCGGTSRESEYRVVLADRTIRYLHSSARVQCDALERPLRVVGITFDITKRKTAEQAVAESEFKFRSLFELSPVGIALNDMQTGQFLDLNASLAEPTGYSRQELLGMTYWDITPARFADSEKSQISALTQLSRYGPYEKEYLRKDGTTYPVLLSGIRVKDDAGRPLIWSIVQDISLRKAMESELADAARHDRLTKLVNRPAFMERLQDAVTRVRNGEQSVYAVLFLDFDRFKLVNDTLGHDAGDELLKQIAQRLQQGLRSSAAASVPDAASVVSRFGGDEFLILINDLNTPDEVKLVAERLIAVLAPGYNLNGSEVHSSASIGITTSGQTEGSAEDAVRNADIAMYEAKRSGGSSYVVFNTAMQTRLTRRVTVENALRRALDRSEMHLVYQPIIDLSSGKMISAEALLRWTHPTLGNIAPGEFIPIAEESGLIVTLGEWVQNEACLAMAGWRARDPLRAPRTVSVNLSRVELNMGRRLLEQIRITLERTGLPAESLQLEITEREVMRNPNEACALLLELQTLGVQIAMDDFGTGTSSLGCLRNYPFNTIKIDRTFVQDLTSRRDVLAVIHATIQLVENLGMASLAEGVEEPAQVAILKSLGCRYAQGFLYSRPVPSAALLDAGSSLETHRRQTSSVSY